MYNMTAVSNATTYYDQVLAVNNMVSGMFGMLLIATLFFIAYFSLSKNDPENGLIAAGFITTVVSIIFVFISITSWFMVMVCLMILIATIIYKMFRGD